jgi:uncharacterized protein YndB with AHSA1/START domain
MRGKLEPLHGLKKLVQKIWRDVGTPILRSSLGRRTRFETPVTLTFAEEGGKTRMTFRKASFQSIEERDGHRGGWTRSFDRLEEYVAHMKA